MVRIKNGCRELTVSDDVVENYLNAGWNVINGHGEVIDYKKPMSYDCAMARIGELETYQKSLQDSLNSANAKIKALESENRKLRKAVKTEE